MPPTEVFYGFFKTPTRAISTTFKYEFKIHQKDAIPNALCKTSSKILFKDFSHRTYTLCPDIQEETWFLTDVIFENGFIKEHLMKIS